MPDNIQHTIAEDRSRKSYDAGDPAAVNEARIKAGREKESRLRVVEALMQHEDGRRWIFEWLEFCNIYGNSVADDVHLTYFNLGQQNVGKRLLVDVQDAAPEAYMVMLRENRGK